MKALTYTALGRFELIEKPKPEIIDPKDAVVRVTLSSICSSDLHILHGAVPQAEVGITVGHELVGIVEAVGSAVSKVKPDDRVAVNVETFCGECFYCRRGYVNNCTSGGWMLGCRIDGGQAEYVRVPYADNGLTPIPDKVSDEQALFVGDILATGYWAAKISEISEENTVLIIGAGPTGLCTLECVQLYNPRQIVVCEADKSRREFVRHHYPNVNVVEPSDCLEVLRSLTEGRGADRVIEVAGGEDTFELAWRCARPNAIVTIVALYEKGTDIAAAVDVWQEPDVQDQRRRCQRLRHNHAAHLRREDRHNPSDNPPLSPKPHPGSLYPIRQPHRRRHQNRHLFRLRNQAIPMGIKSLIYRTDTF